jgi:tRNA(adenine34) deaminase
MGMNDNDFMREALLEAAASRDAGDWAVGCVIVLGDEVVLRGRNRVYSASDRLKHAEMDALAQLQALNFDRTKKDKLTLYTTFEPCPMCFGAILVSGINHVVSGVDFDDSGISSYIEYLPRFFRHPKYETTFKTGVLARDCAEMWLSGAPAKAVIEQGYILPKSIDELQNDDIVNYTTPSMNELD